MTAEDVFKALLAEDADIGLATVYRVLMQFEQAGLLSRSHFESGQGGVRAQRGPAPRPSGVPELRQGRGVLRPEIESAPAAIAESAALNLQEHALSLYARAPRPTARTAAKLCGR
jgi:Fur family ferric uptake transcriptional regulator